MPKYKLRELLESAMELEDAAQGLYLDLAVRASNPGLKKMFQDFAGEEVLHQEQLNALKDEVPKGALAAGAFSLDEYGWDAPGPDATLRETLIAAMKLEKTAFMLYSEMADSASGALKAELLALASAEARHRLHLEIYYDRYYYGGADTAGAQDA